MNTYSFHLDLPVVYFLFFYICKRFMYAMPVYLDNVFFNYLSEL